MPPHVGRGGWTWYTGSAGRMYNVALEWILGFRVRGASFVLDPCIPRAWPKFEISFRHRSARYNITVENPLGVCRSVIAVKLDGEMLTGTQKSSFHWPMTACSTVSRSCWDEILRMRWQKA